MVYDLNMFQTTQSKYGRKMIIKKLSNNVVLTC